MVGKGRERRLGGWGRERPMAAMVERGRSGSCVRLFMLIPCERIDHTWAFPLHVYLYKNYNSNHKWEITTIKTLHDLEDRRVISHNMTYLWQSCHDLSLTPSILK
jgi:hypothetical protein